MFACAMYWFFVITFFFNFRIIILVDRKCWLSGHNHLYITQGHIIIYFLIGTNSMFACFQMYVKSTFSCLFVFSTFIWFFFSPQTCVDSVLATIFTFPVVVQLNVFIAVPNHFVFWKSKFFFLQVSTWRRQCGYLPRTSWKWPENKTNRVRRHLGDKMFSTVAKSVSGSQCLCSTKFVFLSQEHTDIHNTHKHDFLHKK